MATVAVDFKSFEELVEKNDIVILDFWAEWCAPCRAFAPVFEKVSENFPQIVFGKVNTEKEAELASSFRIRSIPTLMIFRESIIIFEQAGSLPENAFTDLVQQVLALDMNQVRAEIAAQENAANATVISEDDEK